MDLLWNQWLVIAFIAPFFWAVMNVLDVYFTSSVYEDEWDGGIISSFFQLSAWLLVAFGLVEFQFPDVFSALVAVSSGVCLSLAFFYYFRTLFASHDVVVIGAIWNLSVPLVPFLAWFLIGERLSGANYLGIALAFIGAMLFVIHERIRANNLAGVFKNMLFAVMLLSLSMVLQNWTYQHAGVGFWSGYLLFSLGAALAAVIMLAIDRRSWRDRTAHLWDLTKHYVHVFLLAESLGLLAIFSSQRAISLSPSVSYVATIESTVPIFVMLISIILATVLFRANRAKAHRLFVDQLDAFWVKFTACCLIGLGIYIIS